MQTKKNLSKLDLESTGTFLSVCRDPQLGLEPFRASQVKTEYHLRFARKYKFGRYNLWGKH
jgi:hypothetical protein